MSPIYDQLIDNIVAFGIAKNMYVYSWYINKEVRAGSATDLDKRIKAYKYVLPIGVPTRNIVGIAIAKSNDYVYAWYYDEENESKTRTYGTTYNLEARGGVAGYTLPSGFTPNHIIDMGISSKDVTYTWYKKEENEVLKCKVSAGSTRNLASKIAPKDCTLPYGKTPNDIIGMAIGPNDYCYAWYKDGTLSAGTSTKLDKYKPLHDYLVRLTLSEDDIIDLITTSINTKLSENYSINCAEHRYVCLTDTEIMILMNEDTESISSFLHPTNDTDDFSFLLKSAFIKEAHKEKSDYSYCVGLIFLTEQNVKNREIYNIAITANKDLICIDHQHNDIIHLVNGGGPIPFEIVDGTVQFISF